MHRVFFYLAFPISFLGVCHILVAFALPHNEPFHVVVTEIVRKNPSLSKLQPLLRKTELGFKLDQSRDLTFLAPDNLAIEEMAFDQISGEYLKYDDTLQILSNHIVPKVIKIEELSEGTHEFETLAGSLLRFEVNKKRDGMESQSQGASVTVSVPHDSVGIESPIPTNGVGRGSRIGVVANGSNLRDGVEAVNGLVYSISKLLIPEGLESAVASAKKQLESGTGVGGGTGAEEAEAFTVEAPEHVQDTNRLHWTQKDAAIASEAIGVLTHDQENSPSSRPTAGIHRTTIGPVGWDSSHTLLSESTPQRTDVGVLYTEREEDEGLLRRARVAS